MSCRSVAGELDCEYKRCLVRERDRYREWAKTRQGAFETYRILHFDADAEEAVNRDRSTSWLGDRGKGAAAVRRCADGIRGGSAAQKVNRARMRVSRRLPHCKTVFRLVLKYGTNWRESVGQLMRLRRGMTLQAAKRLYRRQLWQLVELLERSEKKPTASRASS